MPSRTWTLLAVGFVVAAAVWLRAPALGSVAVLAAVAIPLLAGVGGRAARRRRALVRLASLGFVAVAALHQRALARIGSSDASSRESRAAAVALRDAVAAEGTRLEALAASALAVPADRRAAFDALDRARPSGADRAIVVAEDGRPHAWTGRLLVPLDSLAAPRGLLITPYHVVVYAAARAGRRVAVATTLLHAVRPALAMTAPLDAALATRHGLAGFAYGDARDAVGVADAVVLDLGDGPVAAARPLPLDADARRLAAEEQALPWAVALLALVVLGLVATAWRRGGPLWERLVAWCVAAGVVASVPSAGLSNRSVIFDPSVFFVALGGPFTANAASVAISSALLLLAMLTAVRASRWRPSRPVALAMLAFVAGIGPFALRALAGGIQLPMAGASVTLWLAWQVAFFLAATVVLLPGVIAGRLAVGGARGLPVWVAPLLAALAALSAVLLLEPPARLPAWHPSLWVAAIIALGLSRRGRAVVLPVAIVAACGATALVWLSTTRDRVALAEADVRGLEAADPMAAGLLQRAAASLDRAAAARTRVQMLDAFRTTELAATDYPVEIATWAPDGSRIDDVRVRRGPGITRGIERFAREVQGTGVAVLQAVPGDPGVHLVLAAPHDDGTATTLVVAPRSALVPPDAFGALLGFAPPASPEPPYALRLADAVGAPVDRSAGGLTWARRGDALHGDGVASAPAGLRRLHAEIDLRSPTDLVMRGALLIALDLVLLGALWLLIVVADGVLRRWWRRRRRDLLRSFRVRLSIALLTAFTVPAALFAVWSVQRLQLEDAQARDLLVRETLRGVAVSTTASELRAASQRFDTPLLLYADGLLAATSDPVLDALSPVGRLLPPAIALALADGDDPVQGAVAPLGRTRLRLGFRTAADASGVTFVLAAPARLDDRLLDRRRNDLAVLLLFAMTLGAFVAIWASGAGARQLSEPIRTLRARVLAVARGVPTPDPTGPPPIEFVPVFRAFGRMTVDLAESRAELETAQRRLEATLRNVASGVLALDGEGHVTLANPRAEAILGTPIPPGTPATEALGVGLAEWVATIRAETSDERAIELDRDGRRLQVRATRLGATGRRLVLTIDDVTDVVRAERVLAWGEMARQVAHEIKNPLTPMRLGMQHLQRAHRDGRGDFGRLLEENTARILAEIDRLDDLARTFSRYGVVPTTVAAATAVDAARAVRDVVELERIGAEGIAWRAAVPEAPLLVSAQDRELREVLLNLLENARLAGARCVTVTAAPHDAGGVTLQVADDGSGIAPELLPRIFDPHFSTRSSGSGLGLAMARRLVEAWGGTIAAVSPPGAGATFTIQLLGPPSAAASE
ncbi:MAG: ATP-binding protein [Gemmatimonadota bacterium]|nr:ATP-binding protein [Gemmatimonadota bacterium]